jgi:pteridine reductase
MTQCVALVTGGTQRIGGAISRNLAKNGCIVYIHYHTSHKEAVALQAELSNNGHLTHIVQADLCNEVSITSMIETIEKQSGRLDYLVNNAAIFPRKPLSNVTQKNSHKTWQINCFAPQFIIQQCQHLLEQGGNESPGAVVNIVDNCSAERPWPNYSNYAASKAGLTAITRALAVELAPTIRVNAVGPGAIIFHGRETEAQQQRILSKIPLQRLGSPDEVAQTVQFLLLGPKYITGQLIKVDGGWSIQ